MTLISSPTQPIAVKRDEPPYYKNKSGIPVIGIMPMTIPTLIKKWMINIPKMPEAMYMPKFVLVFFMITIVRNIIIIYTMLFAVASITEIAGLDGYMNLLYLFYPILLVTCFVLLHALLHSDTQTHPACRYGVVAMTMLTVFVGFDALHFEYHRFAGILSTTVFSIYSVIPFVFFLIRKQMLEDARLARQNETLAKELQESQNEAVRDFLTGAYNRHQLADGVAKYTALANTRGFAFSFAIFDVDHFKTVNDTRGHLGGDAILRQIADTVHAKIDRRHIFIRYGGDEFIVLALHHSLTEMRAFCEDLRITLAQTLDGVTLSFGIST